MKKKLLIISATVLMVVVVLACTATYWYMKIGGASESYQHDADIVRLGDLKSLGEQIEEFYTRTGRYPLQGKSDLPNYVHIGTPEQERYIEGGPPYPHVVTPADEFRQEMVSGLGEGASIPFDPQKVPVNKPNFYIYAIDGGTYNLAVHLHNPYPFARKIGEHYYKLEISNSANPSLKIWTLEALVDNEEFIAAVTTPLMKPGFFEHLREEQNR